MRAAVAVALAAVVLLGPACQTVEEELAGPATPTPAPTPAPAPSPQPTAAPTATAIPVTGWTTFTNTKYGYSIDYPADWLVNPGDPAADPSTSDYVVIWSGPPPADAGGKPDPNLLQFQIIALPNAGGLSMEEWLAERDMGSPLPVTVLSTSPVSLDATAGVVRLEKYEGEGTGKPFYVYYFPAGATVVAVTGHPGDESPLADEAEAVLGTFRLH